MSQRPPRCLLIGNTLMVEMRPVVAALQAAFPAQRLAIAERMSDLTGPGDAVDLYVVCQSWPDEYTEEEVARLLTCSVAARLVCVYGRWCDSEGRTRDRWPLAVRVPAAEFAQRLEYELQVLSGAAPPLALTASRGEVFAAMVAHRPAPVSGHTE